uniref:Uncharacterized protein n=1 Tax=Solanum lycopersicum TaxID=4081 RepID=A0A3Q7FCQ7_SOLLC
MFVSPLITRIGSSSIRSLSNFRTRCLKQLHMARPPILALAIPSDTGRVLSIQSHTVQVYMIKLLPDAQNRYKPSALVTKDRIISTLYRHELVRIINQTTC